MPCASIASSTATIRPTATSRLAYYQTLYGTASGKQEAIAGMRGLAERNPGDPRYAVQLGIMLTYDPRTRAEGIRILRAHPNDPDAQPPSPGADLGLRQSRLGRGTARVSEDASPGPGDSKAPQGANPSWRR